MHIERRWKGNIALFLIGQSITLFGSMLVYYAIMWHITLESKNSLMTMLIAAAGTLPVFFISPFAGVWADRYNKKLIINIADAAIAAVTLGMAIIMSMGVDSMGLLLLCLAMRALGQGVQTPAVNALIPELVPQEQLMRINGISSGLHSLVMITSPIVGSALLLIAPIHTLMYIDVATAAIGISVLFFLVKVSKRDYKPAAAQGLKQYVREVKQGLHYIGQKPFLKKFLLLSAFFNILIAPVAVMTPLQVTLDWGDAVWTVLGNPSFGAESRLAVMEIVFFVGMMLGGLLMGIWGGFKNRSHTMAMCTFLLGLGSISLGLMTNFWLYLVCMGLSGVVLNLFNPPMMTTLQSNVDPQFMGRVFSVLTMMSNVMMPIGMLLWGPLGTVVAIDWLLMGTGACIFLMGFIFIHDKALLAAGSTAANAEKPTAETEPA